MRTTHIASLVRHCRATFWSKWQGVLRGRCGRCTRGTHQLANVSRWKFDTITAIKPRKIRGRRLYTLGCQLYYVTP
ncbi:MAG: hypothetical protein ABSA16_02010 [Thermoguttaceae bacterium]